MPTNGIITCRKLRNELKITTPIILSSGNSAEEDINNFYSASRDEFFDKPLKRK